MPVIKVLLQSDEREALQKFAEIERRDPRAQAAVIIRRSLEQRGFLSHDKNLSAVIKQFQGVQNDCQ